jgi:DNA-binding NtrC family response regulator
MTPPNETGACRATVQPLAKITLILAARDRISRTRMARALADRGCTVEMAGSAARLMEFLLRGGRPVVVLADRLAEGLAWPALVSLLKGCNPRAALILAVDELSKQEDLRVRQQGVFYRTSRPVYAAEWDELQLAIDCACRRVQREIVASSCQ